jgi:hypothetical protein
MRLASAIGQALRKNGNAECQKNEKIPQPMGSDIMIGIKESIERV